MSSRLVRYFIALVELFLTGLMFSASWQPGTVLIHASCTFMALLLLACAAFDLKRAMEGR